MFDYITDNSCKYSKNWQPYIGDYDKFEYDIKLKDGTIVLNCYPNAHKFHSTTKPHDGQRIDGSLVAEIRFSEVEKFHINYREFYN